MIRVSIEYAYHRNTRIIRNNTRIVRIRVSYELQTDIRAVMFPGGTRGNAGERGGTRGNAVPPPFLSGEPGTASPLPKSNMGERRSPWQGLNMSEVQWTPFDIACVQP